MPIEITQFRLGIALTFVVAAFIGLLWRPQVKAAERYAEQIEQSEEMLGLSRDRTEKLARLSQEVTLLQARVDANNKVVPSQQDLAGVLRELSVQIEAENLTGQGISTGEIVESPNHLGLPVELTFSGSSIAAFRLIDRIESMPQMLTVESLKLTLPPECGSDGHGVNARAEVTAYFSYDEMVEDAR